MLDDTVYPLKEYLAVAKTSRSTFYKEQNLGIGVDFFRRGDKIYVRHSAHLRHMEKLERDASATRDRTRADAQRHADTPLVAPDEVHGIRKRRGHARNTQTVA